MGQRMTRKKWTWTVKLKFKMFGSHRRFQVSLKADTLFLYVAVFY